jgi:uncharacterized membrane protein YbhN (UPF0104 family)
MGLCSRLIQVLLLVAVVVGLFSALRGLDVSRLWASLGSADSVWLIAGVLVNLASQTTRAIGWNAMLTEPRIRFARLVRIEFAVQAAAAVSPEGAGEFIRLGYLLKEGVARTVTVTLLLVRKFFSSLGLVPLFVVIWWPGNGVPAWGALVISAYLAVLAVVSVLILLVARAPTAPAREARLSRFVFEARTALGPVRRPQVITQVGGAAVLTRVFDMTGVLVTARSLGIDLPWAIAVLILLSVEVSNLLPTAPAQVGTFELAVLIATAGTLDHVEGLALALVFHAQQILPQIPIGIAAIAYGSVRTTNQSGSRSDRKMGY